jgi:hypothetical protein
VTEQIFIPVQQYLESLWPSGLVELPEIEAFEHVWMEPLNVETEPDVTVATALLFETSLELGIPGLDAVKLVIAPLGTATSFMLRFESTPTPSISLVDVPLALRFRGDLLRPARQKPADANGVEEWEVDTTRDFIDLDLATVTVTFDFDGNIAVQASISIDLPPAMIGDSGVVIEAQGLQLFLDTTQPPPGKPAGWRGVHIALAALHLPAGLSSSVGTLSVTDAFIGNGGFSGGVAVDFEPGLPANIAGMAVTLDHAGVSFVQNALTECDIRGTIMLPFFEEALGISIAVGLNGNFAVELLGGANGLIKLTKAGVLELTVASLGFEVENDRFLARISGSLRPLVGGLDWPEFQVQELSIDSDGHVKLEGGWLNLREGYRLNIAGFQFEITKLGLGSTDDGGRWVGFSGGLKLVDGMSAGASVEGLRVTWYEDGRPPGLTLNGVGVEFEVPGVLRFQGEVAMRDLPGGVRRFDGAIRLELTTLNLEIDGQLVIGTAPGYTFLAIYLGVELPVGIPLWTTGLGLYGLAGLMAVNMEPDKGPQEPWYGVGPGEGWYKKPQIGVSDLVKWRNQNGSFALGAGVTIGTVADNGFTFAGRLLLAIVFPGPIVLLEGKANLLKERSALSDDPLFRALVVIDGREGSFTVGLDVEYKFSDGGELIEIGGGAEAMFDFDDPMAWHFYVGQRDPRERRIRAEIFKLFEANAYLMLDAHQLAMGAFVGYEGHWKFGPVRASLEAWLEGDTVVSFKPLHFHGELWLHGHAELKVFGFGFDIGADARVTAEVFDPFMIKIDLTAHLGLPWPLPDFDISIPLQWGPEPNAPALPMPVKEIAIGHPKITTTWPLPRGTAPALLAPDYDPNNDGFLEAPNTSPATIALAPPPANAPVVPLDARPQVSFGRNVNDDALVGINPQAVFATAQPDPGWEWIGDPGANEGPVRIRTGLKEVALDRWVAGSWVAVARKGPGTNATGVTELFGSWAPVPQLPAGSGSSPSPAQTKLVLWSRSGFDYVRHTTGQWSEWWASALADYPCVPIPPDEEICCFVDGFKPDSTPVSPWRCPKHPEFAVGWAYPIVPVPRAGNDGQMLCFGPDDKAELRLGRAVKHVKLFLTGGRPGEAVKRCLDVRKRKPQKLPNPFEEDGFSFTVRDRSGVMLSAGRLKGASAGRPAGLDLAFSARIELPVVADRVTLTITAGAPTKIIARAADASPLDGQSPDSGQQIVVLHGPGIAVIDISAPKGATLLHEICVERRATGLVVAGVDRDGKEKAPVPVQGVVAELDGRNLASVRISGNGQPFCIRGFCVIVGLDKKEQIRREEMNQHLLEETAHWHDEGAVLAPYTQYRLRVVTTLETRDFSYDAGFNTVRQQTEFAYFQTDGPPGIAMLSAPIAAQAPADASTALGDLELYVTQTVPPTVQGPGEKPPLPRPVYRAYDVGVTFNEDYVDLLYRASGRDLGLYLFDVNNQPARDVFGRLLVAPNRWGRAETLSLTATDQTWVDLVNASSCAAIDSSLIVKPRTLGIEGQVLSADATYEARLVPLLLHETFAHFTLGAVAIGNGAAFSGPGGGWVVADVGANNGPSHWEIAEAGAPPIRHVEQQSNIWGGPGVASDPANPGTILLRAADPALAADHAAQPANWTDYRLTAVLHAIDNDAIGLVFRYRGAGDHYFFAMDRERSYRRLVRVAGGVYTVLAADQVSHELNSDIVVTVEAFADRLAVIVDGESIFAVSDAEHAQGGIGLYCWAMQGARFSDIRVDDFRAAAPVVYRFTFITSRFANFYHHLHSGNDRAWRVALPDNTGLAEALAAAATPAALPAAISDPERRAYEVLAGKIAGTAARADTKQVEATAATFGGGIAALLMRTAEPIDWSRTTLAVSRASGAGPAFADPDDAAAASGPVRIADWSTAPAGPPQPAAESVTLLLDAETDPDGWRLEYRTLSSAGGPPTDGVKLLEDPFTGIAESEVVVGAVLFAPEFDDLTGLTVTDPPGFPFPVPSQWKANAGVVTQTKLTGQVLGGPTPAFAMRGTHLLAEPVLGDVRITLIVRCDTTQGAFGVVFRYSNESNYYRFSMSAAGDFFRLVKRNASGWTLLWEAPGPVPNGVDSELTIETVGGAIRVLLDGVLLCAVRDTDFAAGLVGLYTWRCKGASFAKFKVRALGGTLEGWSLLETGPLDAPALWRREGAALKQVAAIAGAAAATVDALTLGAYGVAGDGAWNDVRVRVRIATEPADAAGVAWRWQGREDHMLLLLDSRNGEVKLVRREGGATSVLASRAMTLPSDGSWQEVLVEAIGTRVRAWLNNALIFDLHDQANPTGAIALFAAASGGARFAGLRVETALPAWLAYATIGGVGRCAAGRRVRVFAGREADVTAPPATAERRAYQGFLPGDAAGVRLPAEGVDLRLRNAQGEIAHARRFAPDSAFASAPVKLLRAADGTGLIVVPDAAALGAGVYRFDWQYRRDNSASVAGSLVQSENGDTASETARIDVFL